MNSFLNNLLGRFKLIGSVKQSRELFQLQNQPLAISSSHSNTMLNPLYDETFITDHFNITTIIQPVIGSTNLPPPIIAFVIIISPYETPTTKIIYLYTIIK